MPFRLIQPAVTSSPAKLTPGFRLLKAASVKNYIQPQENTRGIFDGPSFKASDTGSISDIPVNLAKTVGNIPSSAATMVKDTLKPTADLLNNGAPILKDIFSQGAVQGIKNIGSGFADTFVKIGRAIYGGTKQAADALNSDPVKALGDALHFVATKSIEDPLLIPSLMVGGGEAAKAGELTKGVDAISAIAKPITRGTDTSFSNVSSKIIKPVSNKIDSAVQSAAQKSLQNYSNDLEEFFTGTKRGKKLVTNEQLQGKSTSDFLSRKLQEVAPNERDAYIPKVEGGKFMPDNTITALKSDAQILDSALSDVIASEGKIVNLNEVRRSMLDAVKTESRLKRAEVADAQKIVNETMDKYIGQFGENAPLSRVQDIKQGLYSKGYLDFDPSKGAANLQKSVARDMARVAKDTIERNVDDFNVKAINKEIGDHYNAIGTLEKLSGGAVKGGRLGRYSARIIGAAAGAPGGFIGTLTGAAGADVVAQFLIDTSISGPIRNALIKQLAQRNPEILAEALKKVAKNRSNKLLSAPKAGAAKVGNNIPINLGSKSESTVDRIERKNLAK